MASSLPLETDAGPMPVASWRHTVRLAGIFVVLGASGLLLPHGSVPASAAPEVRPHMAGVYAMLIGAEWLLFRAVNAGLRPRSLDWRTLMGRDGSGIGDLARDVLLGVLLCAVWVAAVAAVRSSSAGPPADLSLLPTGAVETVLWVALALSAGFCEEIAFRGYFQRQFEALTGRPGTAVAMQAILFAISHAYQGIPSALAIGAYGVLFGVLALWRGRLRPGMVAHALTDLVLGLFGR
jgi:membrane protease YdiL (CAAX protease family)